LNLKNVSKIPPLAFVIANDQKERGNLLCSKPYEIASVVSLPRNDITTQAPLPFIPSRHEEGSFLIGIRNKMLEINSQAFWVKIYFAEAMAAFSFSK
jgi:hypothetical protein